MANRRSPASKSRKSARSGIVLVVDVGGTHIKVKRSDDRRIVKLASGPSMTAAHMAAAVHAALGDAHYDLVSVGYPGVVFGGKPLHEPFNLGAGWVGFDFAKAFGRPTIVINDAAMQALGAYRGGHMLFLGLGTGLGAALIVDGVIEPMEIAHLPYRKDRSYEDYAGKAGLKRLGTKKWLKHVLAIVQRLSAALEVEDVVIGGGNAVLVTELPAGVRRGSNADAFAGGVRMWRGPGLRAAGLRSRA